MSNLATLSPAQTDAYAQSNSANCRICGSSDVHSLLTSVDRFHNRHQRYELMRCSSCSLVWLKDPPAPEDMSVHYGPDYHRAISWAADSSPLRWKLHLDLLLAQKQGGAILDLGCNSGTFLGTLDKKAWSLHGVEIDPAQAEQARQRTGADVFTGDVLDAPFAPGSFDVITAFDVMEHMYKPDEVVRMAMKWLKPGGIFYVSLPNIDSWEAKALGTYWFGLELPRHLFLFSPKSLRRLFTTAGYREVHLATPSAAYVEHSFRYIFDDALRACGISRPPISQAKRPPFLWRAVRKANRLTTIAAIRKTSELCGRGPNLEAIFRK
jgi:SAM-dependent methyltransferase